MNAEQREKLKGLIGVLVDHHFDCGAIDASNDKSGFLASYKCAVEAEESLVAYVESLTK